MTTKGMYTVAMIHQRTTEITLWETDELKDAIAFARQMWTLTRPMIVRDANGTKVSRDSSERRASRKTARG